MKYLQLNINDNVLVKLTSFGKEIYINKFENFSTLKQERENLKRILKSKTDKNGYTKLQMHEIMHLYGEYLFNGTNKLPFENNTIWPEIENDNQIIEI